jgi:hypothetical protein
VIGSCDTDRLEKAEALLSSRDQSILTAFSLAELAGADPDRCAGGRWIAHMLRGDFESAWKECDAIRHRGANDPNRFWNGQPVDGRQVIIRCLHGFGDALQFLRYIPKISARAASVVIEVPPALYELAPYIDGAERIITWGDLAPATPPDWEVQLEVMELPYYFRTALRDVPIRRNYLQIPRAVRDRVILAPSHLPRVGLVWAAGEWNPRRSLPFSYIKSLVADSRCEFWSLQGGHANTDWKAIARSNIVRDAEENGTGLLTLATTVLQLDLVITVDTLAAHLAGALGKPAWVLLEHAADWRWMTDRADSPWYPSLRLFRQHSPGDWAGVINCVKEELQAWARTLHPLCLTA